MDDKRKAIENDVYFTWFNSKYQESVCSAVFHKWQTTDTFVQIGIALTASGSAVAGWSYWEIPEMKIIWGIISVSISIAAICHKAVGVTNKIKIWSESSKVYSMIKNQLEVLKFDINTSYDENADYIHKKLREIQLIYADEDPKTPDGDFWLKKSLEDKILMSIYESNQKTNFEKELKIVYDKYKTSKQDKERITK